MKRTLITRPVLALPFVSCVALAGCLGNTTETIDVQISQSAYDHLYPGATRSAQSPATAPVAVPTVRTNADAVNVTVPNAAPAAAPASVRVASARTAPVTPAPTRAAPPAPRRAPAPAAAPAPRPAPAPAPAPAAAPVDTCGAGQYQGLIGGPVQGAIEANLPSLTRFYGSGEAIDPRQTPARVNVVVSTTDPAEALTNGGTVTRIFCG